MTPKEYLKQTDMMRNVLTMGQGILKHLSFEVLSGLQIWSQRLKMQNMLCCP